MVMKAKMLGCVIGFWSMSVAWGQAPPSPATGTPPRFLPGTHANAQELLEDRKRFIQEMYGLQGPDLDKVMQAISESLAMQQQYQARYAKTLDRMDLALALVRNDFNMSENDRAAKAARFQRQIVDVNRKAPLSLNNVIRIVDRTVAPEQAAAAKARMLSRFGETVRGTSNELDPMQLEDLMVRLAPPTKRPDLPLSPPPAPPQETASAPPATPAQASPTPAVAVGPQSVEIQPMPNPPTPIAPAPAPPPPPPKEYPPAPPIPEWEKYFNQTMVKYHFTEVQKQVAKKIYDHCLKRANEHHEKNKADYEAADKLSADEKARTVARLNKPIDVLYDELVQRLDSVASVEQKLAAAGSQPAQQ